MPGCICPHFWAFSFSVSPSSLFVLFSFKYCEGGGTSSPLWLSSHPQGCSWNILSAWFMQHAKALSVLMTLKITCFPSTWLSASSRRLEPLSSRVPVSLSSYSVLQCIFFRHESISFWVIRIFDGTSFSVPWKTTKLIIFLCISMCACRWNGPRLCSAYVSFWGTPLSYSLAQPVCLVSVISMFLINFLFLHITFCKYLM